ncbi:MAG: hypothetical protein FWB84_08615 [Candidatus Bathyarchaeota archaeon]|uniref:hypothetical protein n=1 Tax=Candidatus Bathycorpusculum sp. TaxID=2994959 RepID=UPI00282DF36E|nr:hypothetical protein [Candidatus Termiticorpusculum sp.]MCL2258198.1 hypothetical protein [Candidatus Termiticorpusculum sp.]
MRIKRTSGLIATLTLLCVIATSGCANATYVNSVTFYSFYSGYSANISYITGAHDGKYAEIIGPAANDGGQLQCTMTATNATSVTIYAFGVGEVYIVINGQIFGPYINPTQPIHINVGSSFSSVAIAVFNPTGSSHLYIDCISTP